MTDAHLPEGFHPHTRHSGLTAPWEPIYARHDAPGLTLAIRAGGAHTNSRGFVHGGLISALADNAMGLSCIDGERPPAGLVTVSLSVDFVGTARTGQWLEVRASAIKSGRSLSFAQALVVSDGQVCARASGVFKALAPPA
ncbi:PaaI family thioesterase [Alloalcanivorax mobilis]|uniref:PaaI family thioesterase n=1 Tax=Alloalcanivorax mobilis TaxID=2019569 RepID=UPI000B5B429E|nr:PaaI family thioesterase [Alloalcanivorax mobilis]ASK36238.1 thioesterase [Alcanivorax sp. N3-2A]